MYKVVVRPRYNIFDALVAYEVSLIYDGYTERTWYYDAIISHSLGKMKACHKAEKIAKRYKLNFYFFKNQVITI